MTSPHLLRSSAMLLALLDRRIGQGGGGGSKKNLKFATYIFHSKSTRKKIAAWYLALFPNTFILRIFSRFRKELANPVPVQLKNLAIISNYYYWFPANTRPGTKTSGPRVIGHWFINFKKVNLKANKKPGSQILYTARPQSSLRSLSDVLKNGAERTRKM